MIKTLLIAVSAITLCNIAEAQNLKPVLVPAAVKTGLLKGRNKLLNAIIVSKPYPINAPTTLAGLLC